MTKNSALDRIRVRKLVEIQLETFEIAVSKIVMLREKPAADSVPVKLSLECRLHRAVSEDLHIFRNYSVKRSGVQDEARRDIT